VPGSTFKRCTCRDQATGRPLGRSCPRLRRPDGRWSPDHGSWGYQHELPKARDGHRRPHRRLGFDNATDAQDALDHVTDLLALAEDPDQAILIGDVIEEATTSRVPPPSVAEMATRLRTGTPTAAPPTLAEYLPKWLAGRRNLAEGTRRSYEAHLRLHLVPNLGPVRVDRLRLAHLNDMVDAIEDRNTLIRAARASGDRERRAAVTGMRTVGPATLHRIRATVRKALNDAIRAQLITANPASHLELPSGRRPKPVVWTAERVTRWQATGTVPSAVMVWTPAQTGAFLDAAAEHRLYALFHLIAHRGLRRGEACGLHWTDLDLDNGHLTVTWQIVQYGWATELKAPKTEGSERVVALDADTVAALRAHRTRQRAERLAAGAGWTDTGLVFTKEDGTALHPATVTDLLHALTAAAGLPPVRLHDLRHGAATIALAAGTDMKIVQEMLGHSSITLTSDTYTSVLPEIARAAAENTASLIPRASRARPA
jgi:integrase